MDLDSLKFHDEVTFNVKHPGTGTDLLDDDGKPMTITVATALSPVYKRAMFEAAERMAAHEDGDRYKQRQKLTMQALAGAVKAWTVQVGGKVPPVNAKAVMSVFDKHPWLADQVADHAQDRSGFFSDASPKPSST